VAELLALVAAFLFAVAATLQQKGALTLGVSPDSMRSLAGLVRSRWWLVGTGALLCGYVVQTIALDHGRLAIIQPLLVTTVVFALPLGYFLTQQEVGMREIIGRRSSSPGSRSSQSSASPRAGRTTHPTTSGSSGSGSPCSVRS